MYAVKRVIHALGLNKRQGMMVLSLGMKKEKFIEM
jgi:hypothetical protein